MFCSQWLMAALFAVLQLQAVRCVSRSCVFVSPWWSFSVLVQKISSASTRYFGSLVVDVTDLISFSSEWCYCLSYCNCCRQQMTYMCTGLLGMPLQFCT